MMLCNAASAVGSCPSGYIEIEEPAIQIALEGVCPTGYTNLGEAVNCKNSSSGVCYLYAQLCAAGITKLVLSNGATYRLYDEKATTPSLVVQAVSGEQCFGNLAAGVASGALNVSFGGQTYHAVN